MKRILWISRHQPLPSQVLELQRIYGVDCEIKIDQNRFYGFEDILKRVEKYQPDELLLMAPLSVCRKVLESGIKPLYAEMRKSDHPEVTTHKDGKTSGYEFVKFMRLTRIEVRFQELTIDKP
jgi:hypothetical protein